jgi:hypothetical protein
VPNCLPAYCRGSVPENLTPSGQAWQEAYCGGTVDTPEKLAALLATPPCEVISIDEQIKQGTFGGINTSALKPHEVLSYEPGSTGLSIECAEGYFRNYLGNCQQNFSDEWDAGKFFTEIGIGTAQFVATGLTFAFGGPAAIAATSLAPIASYYGKEANLSFDLGGVFGGVATALGGLESGNYLSALQGVSQVAAGFAPQPSYNPLPSYYPPQPTYGPVYSPPPMYPPPAQPVMSQVPAVLGSTAVVSATRAIVAPILLKVAAALGKRGITLSRAVELARKLGKFFTSPEAIALYLGIGVGELATLITANSARKRRRMNPANSKALRRAARRIKSFHRLCTHTDVLKGRGRRSASVARCGTCRKSPCRC